MPLRGGIGGDHILYIDFNERFDLDSRIRDAERQGRDAVVRQLCRCRDRAGILVADVSGHRMTDAMIAAMLHQSFLLGAYYELEIFGEITTKVFEHINERFYRTSNINRYFTMIYGEISIRGRFRFINAGHHPPAVFSKERGQFVSIGEARIVSSIPVGMLPSAKDPDAQRHPSAQGHKKLYEVNEIDLLGGGDILLLYTDGFSEHAEGSYFPDEPERVLAAHKDDTAEEICLRLRESMIARAPQQDDASVVVVKYTP
jgi:serine phosphatase RsbU (regulator of sigma subunit)